jgi:hypothetical protein
MIKDKNEFKFFVPCEIEKGEDKQGKKVMKIKGVASTNDEDSDEETLNPSGFDLSYFKKNGFINWHHSYKDKPTAVIGEPTLAEVRKNELYIEGLLYDSKLANEVYELAETLEKSGSKRRLGFSIEGKATERGSEDKNHPLYRFIKKAKITGVAVTPTPKNASTIVDIMKGNFSEMEIEDEPEVSANGGKQTIIDITKPNGDRVMVDADYKITILSKAADTSDTRALIKEDLDGKLTDLQNSDKKNKKDKEKIPKFVSINKSMFFDEILKATNDFELTKKVINSINFKSMETNNKKVNLDELVKALTSIGVEVDPTILQKGENTEKTPEEIAAEEAKKAKEADDFKKAQEAEALSKGKDNDEDDKDKDKDKKDDEIEKNTMKKSDDKDKDDKNKDDDSDKDKSEKKKKEKFEKLEKSFKDEIGAVSNDMNKGLSEISSLMKSFVESIDKRVSAIENQSTGRKSMGTVNVIEKSFGGAEDKNNDGKTKLSISENKQQISNVLLSKSGIQKGEANKLYCDAIQEFEAAGTLSKAVVTDLYVNNNILITK